MATTETKEAFQESSPVANEVLTAIKERRTVRFYDQNKEIPKDLLLKVIEAGHFAPSAKNLQPWHFVVITNPAMIDKVMSAKLLTRPEGDSLKNYRGEDIEAWIPKAFIVVFFEKTKSVLADKRYHAANSEEIPQVSNYSLTDIMSIGCSLQNMSLAAHSLGLGSCICGDVLLPGINPEIYSWLNVDREKYDLMCGLKIGWPRKIREPIDEKVRFE
ncbi:MAG: nitroreductase family protein [Nanoarchaeota archaeon]